MSRDYLGDEVHMMQSDILILRQENELLKMTSERKGEENRILREELANLRVSYEEKMTEAVAIRTCLEGVGLNISTALARYMERRTLKKETLAVAEPPRSEQRSRPLVETPRVAPAPPPRVPVERDITEDNIEPPAFLRQGQVRTDIRDSRLPTLDLVTDEDSLRGMLGSLDSRRQA